ncbi:MAG: BrnT family toxin [Caldilineae bacterium]|nr:BrnT family toxin [Caldilineae bacterium]
MKYEWDEDKRQSNIKTHGLDFADVVDFDWTSALILVDDRQDYGEIRQVAFGKIRDRLCVLTFTWRNDVVRIISFRKANSRERKRYDSRIED